MVIGIHVGEPDVSADLLIKKRLGCVLLGLKVEGPREADGEVS